MIKDDEYLEEFKDRKDLDAYAATTGNVGKVDGHSKQQIERRAGEMRHLKEVWKRTQEVQGLKNKLQKKLNMTVEEIDVADKALGEAHNVIARNENKV